MVIRKFEDIEAWQLARELGRRVYEVMSKPAFAKDFELRDQIRSAAGSAMHNIAEGFDGGSNPEFIKFLRYAQRSCTEVQSELYMALDQNYISNEEFEELHAEAKKTRSKTGASSSTLQKAPNQPLRHERCAVLSAWCLVLGAWFLVGSS